MEALNRVPKYRNICVKFYEFIAIVLFSVYIDVSFCGRLSIAILDVFSRFSFCSFLVAFSEQRNDYDDDHGQLRSVFCEIMCVRQLH